MPCWKLFLRKHKQCSIEFFKYARAGVSQLLNYYFSNNWIYVYRSHEEMSLKMIDYIVDEHNIDIDSESLKKVKVLLNIQLYSYDTLSWSLRRLISNYINIFSQGSQLEIYLCKQGFQMEPHSLLKIFYYHFTTLYISETDTIGVWILKSLSFQGCWP